MTDIVSINQDLGLFDTQVARATNILSVQIQHLEYASELGIDLKYFLSNDFQFQNEAFKSYLIQVLANYGINVSVVTEAIDALLIGLSFDLKSSETTTGLVAR